MEIPTNIGSSKNISLAHFAIGTTCKNLLAPENGDIDYILEENERDDITILQVHISCVKKYIHRKICRVFMFNYLITTGWSTVGI